MASFIADFPKAIVQNQFGVEMLPKREEEKKVLITLAKQKQKQTLI